MMLAFPFLFDLFKVFRQDFFGFQMCSNVMDELKIFFVFFLSTRVLCWEVEQIFHVSLASDGGLMFYFPHHSSILLFKLYLMK